VRFEIGGPGFGPFLEQPVGGEHDIPKRAAPREHGEYGPTGVLEFRQVGLVGRSESKRIGKEPHQIRQNVCVRGAESQYVRPDAATFVGIGDGVSLDLDETDRFLEAGLDLESGLQVVGALFRAGLRLSNDLRHDKTAQAPEARARLAADSAGVC